MAKEYEEVGDRWLEQRTQDRKVFAAFSKDNDFPSFLEGSDDISANVAVTQFIL